MRQSIARVSNVIQLLDHHSIILDESVILMAYEASLAHEAKEILSPDVAMQIIDHVRASMLDNQMN